jgi:flagellar hook-associated protein 1 FlgK
MADLFNIGLSGLRAQQAALAVTGQNITNASTPGYSRQRVEAQALVTGTQGGSFQGGGVRIEDIARITDEFATKQVRTDTSLFAELNTFNAQVQQIEGTLLSDYGGLDSALQSFFDSLQLASSDPSDTANRSMVLGEAQNLSARFQSLAARFNEQQSNVTSVLHAGVARVNELAEGIARLNDRIAALQGNGEGGASNSLLDQRDEMLRELSTHVNVTVASQADGQVNVFIGKGQPVVLGSEASRLELTPQGQVALWMEDSAEPQIVTSALTGGEIGGVLEFRDQVLNPAINHLGRIALAVSAEVNQAHAAGIDLNGDPGGQVFTDLNAPEHARQRAVADEGNTSRPSLISVTVDDPLQVPVSDYDLVFDEASSGSFFVRRASDGKMVFQGRLSGELPQTLQFDHISVTLESGEYAPGDVYHLQPLRNAAGAMGRVLDDPALLALAGTVRASEGYGNRGDAVMEVGEVFDADHPIFASADGTLPPLLVRFTSATSYEILDNSDPADPRPLNPPLANLPYAPGQDNSLLPGAGTALVRFEGSEAGRLPDSATILPGLGSTGNGYSSQTFELIERDPATGSVLRHQAVNLGAGSSARQIAAEVSSLAGVSARAETELSLSNLVSNGVGTPLGIAINGVNLGDISSLNELADAVNGSDALRSQGIEAWSDGSTLRLRDAEGDDLTVQLAGDPTDSVLLGDGSGGTLSLNGAGAGGDYRTATVGGTVSAWLEPNLELSSASGGVMANDPEHHRADLGFELFLTGRPQVGDTFTVEHNTSGIGDNRNGLRLAGLLSQPLMGNPKLSFTDSYGQLVQTIGVQSSQSQINREAAASLLEQSTARRESVSGVNLDEEAANLIRFEQAYNAAAQIISVARETFNTLYNAVQ